MPTSPHDRLVKKTFEQPENAAGELQAVLPAPLVAAIDWSTLRLEPGSFVDDDAREHHTDLLFSAVIRETRAYVFVLFEHQSSPDPWMPLRMLGYLNRVWSRLREEGTARLPLVVPFILYNGERGWTVARSLGELLDADEELLAVVRPYVPDFTLLIDDLVRVSEGELLERPMTSMGRLTVWALRAVRARHEAKYLPRWAAELEEARRTAGPEALRVWFIYLYEVQEGELILDAVLNEGVSESVREVGMGLGKKLEDKGRAEGLAQGLAQGREEGREEGRRTLAAVLANLLHLKFGAPSAQVRQRLDEASAEDLARWTERVLTAATLDDVFGS
jgi:predicted transposase/invertase (TIGR01784 family)